MKRSKLSRFEDLVSRVQACRSCPRMSGRTKVLGFSNGSIESRLIFVAEAPGRNGADKYGVPLYGDKTGDNFEFFLAAAGINRGQIFITNAVLCNPRATNGNNDSPSAQEISNCSQFLNETHSIVEPEYVISLGATALRALMLIEPHQVQSETVKAGDIADILKAIESMVEAQVFQTHPEVKKDQIVIGFTNIRAASVDLQFYSAYNKIAESSFQELGHAIELNKFTGLPGPSFKAVIAVSAFSRKYKCDAEIVHQNKKRTVLAKITPDTKIEQPSPLRGETTIYAKVVRVGGKEPKVEVETVDGYTLYCDAPLEVVTNLGSKLYQVVGLMGIAKWDQGLNNIEEFSIKDVTQYQKVSFKRAMDELAEATKQYYSDVSDVSKYISDLRGHD